MHVTIDVWGMVYTAILGIALAPAFLDVNRRHGFGIAILLFVIALGVLHV